MLTATSEIKVSGRDRDNLLYIKLKPGPAHPAIHFFAEGDVHISGLTAHDLERLYTELGQHLRGVKHDECTETGY